MSKPKIQNIDEPIKVLRFKYKTLFYKSKSRFSMSMEVAFSNYLEF